MEGSLEYSTETVLIFRVWDSIPRPDLFQGLNDELQAVCQAYELVLVALDPWKVVSGVQGGAHQVCGHSLG
jgi:hypothetical protein